MARGSRVPGLAQALRRGRRTFLRPFTARDETEYLALRRASAEFLRPREPRSTGDAPPFSAQEYAVTLSGTRAPNRLCSLLCSLDDGAILGQVNLNEIVRGAFHSAYLGYWIGAPHARQGLMGEGLTLAIREAFSGLRLHRLEANIAPDNVPSLALVKRLGFRKEGYSPRYLKIAGRWTDHERWALLADEWPPKRE